MNVSIVMIKIMSIFSDLCNAIDVRARKERIHATTRKKKEVGTRMNCLVPILWWRGVLDIPVCCCVLCAHNIGNSETENKIAELRKRLTLNRKKEEETEREVSTTVVEKK
jgi:hypothetical protein